MGFFKSLGQGIKAVGLDMDSLADDAATPHRGGPSYIDRILSAKYIGDQRVVRDGGSIFIGGQRVRREGAFTYVGDERIRTEGGMTFIGDKVVTKEGSSLYVDGKRVQE